jgi:alcohol dehydrogenase, propanol-preferring
MRAARMHGYNQPLVLEDVAVPDMAADEVLIRVTATGMCRTDAQLLDGYFKDYHPLTFPMTPGHEIAGAVEKIGSLVPKTTGLTEGDQVVVVGGWGDGTCRLCQAGDTQICGHGKWPPFAFYGGYAEFLPVPYEYLIRVDKKYNLKAEELAPLTDAGLTPYRGIKKLRNAGALGPDRVLAVIGIGGLGAYAVQYAKLLSSGAMVVAFGRNDEKLAVVDGDTVIIFFDANGTARDGIPYGNTYAWFLDMRDGKVIKDSPSSTASFSTSSGSASSRSREVSCGDSITESLTLDKDARIGVSWSKSIHL